MSPLYLCTFESPLGPIQAASTEIGLCRLDFSVASRQELVARRVAAAFPDCVTTAGTISHLNLCGAWLDDYFGSKLGVFRGKLDLRGTPFELEVWRELLSIPSGSTTTYAKLADKIGTVSARAVGTAVGKNPVSLIVPCHRVVGSDGSLTGYAGGLDRKEWLLSHEGAQIAQASLF